MKSKENLIVMIVAIVLFVYLSTADVSASTKTGTKRIQKDYDKLFTIVEDLFIPHFEKIDLCVVYYEKYSYNISSARITYYSRKFYYYATMVGPDRNIKIAFSYPKHVNKSTNETQAFKWTNTKYTLYPICDVCGTIENATPVTYTVLESRNIIGEYSILFNCDGAIIPYAAEKDSLNLKYK